MEVTMVTKASITITVLLMAACGGRTGLDEDAPMSPTPEASAYADSAAEAKVDAVADVDATPPHDATSEGDAPCYQAVQDCGLYCTVFDPVTGALVAQYSCTIASDWSFYTDGGPPALVCTSSSPAPKLNDICILPDGGQGLLRYHYN
jgi:hypothetical protein